MKVKNIGSKIVSIGEITILPGETKSVSDAYKQNAAIDCLRENGNIEIVSAQKPAESGEPTPAQAEDDGGKKYISRMTKAELLEECLRLGLEVDSNDTKDSMIDKIKEATAE